jgi:hypothetical protein
MIFSDIRISIFRSEFTATSTTIKEVEDFSKNVHNSYDSIGFAIKLTNKGHSIVSIENQTE